MRWNQVLSYCAVTALLLFNCTPTDEVGAGGALGAEPGCLGKPVPVIPGAQGFGIYTPAGRCGQILKVTSLEDDGPGSLRRALRTEGPRVIVFEVSGIIKLRDEIEIIHPYLTIAGQTAPSPGITVIGAGIYIQASNVLMQHISVFPGDEPGGPDYEGRDAITIGRTGSKVKNVVLDHVSVGWATDENISVIKDTDNITLRHVLVAEPMVRTRSGRRNAGYGALFYGKGKLDVQGSFFAHVRQRAPLTRIGSLVFVNNVLYDRGQSFITMGNADGGGRPDGSTSKTAFVGNVFIEGESLRGDTEDLPVTVMKKAMLNRGSKIYLDNNYWSDKKLNNEWDLVKNEPDHVKAGSPPAWVDGIEVISGESRITNWVLANVGARPKDRNDIDERILSNFRKRRGSLRDCVSGCGKSVGGWPNLSKRKKGLKIPDDPHGDDDDDGYSNLEEWLHKLADKLEPSS